MNKVRIIIQVLCVLLISFFQFNCANDYGPKDSTKNSITLLNVSYDPTREMYQEINKKFIAEWKSETGQDLTINQSHGGSGKQARSVIDGLEADVVTLALAYDIDAIAEKAKLLSPGWASKFEHNSSPFTSTIVFLVKKGNPKNIKDWNDLARGGIGVITPNPKTSGGARWNYLAAWAYAAKKFNNDESKIKEFLSKIIKNVLVFDSGARGATNTFVQRGIGDVLLAWENEALLVTNTFGKNDFEIVYPSISILAEPPVAVIDKVVDKKGTRKAAEAYLKFLYTNEGQEIAAKHYYRPSDSNILSKFNKSFPQLNMVAINDMFGSWKDAQKKHFTDNGIFDQLSIKK